MVALLHFFLASQLTIVSLDNVVKLSPQAKLDSSVQAKRNLDEAYCIIKIKYLNQHVCPHIVDYYGFTTVRQSIQNPYCFLEPPLLLQIHMELMACESVPGNLLV